MKRGMKQYYKPTPLNMRKLGDGLLAVSTFVTASAIASNINWVALTSLFIGSIGKFLTNYFSE